MDIEKYLESSDEEIEAEEQDGSGGDKRLTPDEEEMPPDLLQKRCAGTLHPLVLCEIPSHSPSPGLVGLPALQSTPPGLHGFMFVSCFSDETIMQDRPESLQACLHCDCHMEPNHGAFVLLQKDVSSGITGVTAYLCRPGHAVNVSADEPGLGMQGRSTTCGRACARGATQTRSAATAAASARGSSSTSLGQSMRARRSDAISSGQAGAHTLSHNL